MISLTYLFELVSYDDNIEDVADVYAILSKFTPQEKKMTGGRGFYDPSEYSLVESLAPHNLILEKKKNIRLKKRYVWKKIEPE